MKTLFKNYRLPENLDVLFLLVFGILLQMTDGSPFTMKERWMIVWETELPVEYFSLFMQKAIKTVLSIIVVIRCVTTYAYVVSAMLVIFCLLKNSAPRLMLLWLLIAGIKSILLTFVEALTGVYVCSAFGKIRKACIEFVISKALEIIFAAYLWGSVLNIFQEMERKAENTKKFEIWEHLFMQKRDLGCQRARSLLDESTLYKTACLNNFEFRDVPQIILQMLRRQDEMSSDSLLDPGMMLASVSNMGSFDNLKVSLSLGELGFIDLRSAQVLGLEDDETLSPQDKALKFLGLTWNDVKEIQQNRTTVGSDIYKIDKKTWKRVADGRTLVSKPKRGRGEVFIRELHRVELEEESRKPRKKSFDFKFSWSFFNLYAQKEVSPPEMDDDQYEEEEGAFEEENDDEEKEDEEPTPLFMSNIKEEVAVNRIHLNFVSKKWKANAYAELYRQDFMSVIGPEVFDKASKLPQITFLKNARNYNETVMSVSLPTFEDPTQENQKEESFYSDSEEKIYNISSLELDFSESEQTSAHFLEEKTNTAKKMELEIPADEKKDAEEETISAKKNLSECEAINTQSEKNFEESKTEFPSEQNRFKANEKLENANSASAIVLHPKLIGFREQLPPCCRKRRIIIKRIGKQTAGIISPKNQSQNLLKNSEICLNCQFESAFAREKAENKKNLETPFAQSHTSFVGPNSDGKAFLASHNEQTHFLTELFQKPVSDALVTCDSKKTARVQKKAEMGFWEERADLSKLLGKFKLKGYDAMLHKRGSEERQKKIWKSEVLKRVEASRRKCSQVSFLEKKSSGRKLLKYCLQKNNLTERGKEMMVSLWVANGRECEHCCNNVLCGSEESVDFAEEKSKSFCERFTAGTLVDLGSRPKTVQTTRLSSSQSPPEEERIKCVSLRENSDLQLSSNKLPSSETDSEKSKTENESKGAEEIGEENSELVSASQMFETAAEDEPISLYYSKAANLASPLLDMERFIYPDRIHYSYKHVKKKGFDVEINGGFPLLVRESLAVATPELDSPSPQPELVIVRRPMDLSFAKTSAFAKWQSSDQNLTYPDRPRTKKTKSRSKIECSKEQKPPGLNKSKKTKKFSRKSISENGSHYLLQSEFTKTVVKHCKRRNFSNFKQIYSSDNYLLIEKLLEEHWSPNGAMLQEGRTSANEQRPIRMSSAQLHSNKGRMSSTYNPAVLLQRNKCEGENKKLETQEKRTKDMFARLEGEALLQSKNVHRFAGQSRRL